MDEGDEAGFLRPGFAHQIFEQLRLGRGDRGARGVGDIELRLALDPRLDEIELAALALLLWPGAQAFRGVLGRLLAGVAFQGLGGGLEGRDADQVAQFAVEAVLLAGQRRGGEITERPGVGERAEVAGIDAEQDGVDLPLGEQVAGEGGAFVDEAAAAAEVDDRLALPAGVFGVEAVGDAGRSDQGGVDRLVGADDAGLAGADLRGDVAVGVELLRRPRHRGDPPWVHGGIDRQRDQTGHRDHGYQADGVSPGGRHGRGMRHASRGCQMSSARGGSGAVRDGTAKTPSSPSFKGLGCGNEAELEVVPPSDPTASKTTAWFLKLGELGVLAFQLSVVRAAMVVREAQKWSAAGDRSGRPRASDPTFGRPPLPHRALRPSGTVLDRGRRDRGGWRRLIP